jgi:surface antigen
MGAASFICFGVVKLRVFAGRRALRRPVYSGTAALRLCGRRRFAATAALLTALGSAGCSYQLDSMFSKPDAEVTGSIGHVPDAPAHAATAQVSEADLAYARAAAADALGRKADANSVPWRNPQTGVGGNITPLASAYSDGGASCRDFLASYVSAGAQAWLQGSACRSAGGEWQVKSLKPLKSG